MIQAIAEQHAEEAAFLWSRRDAAVLAPHYDLRALDELDERIEAHLDGLRVGGAAGRAIAGDRLASDDPGAVFAAAVLAVQANDEALVNAARDLAVESPAAARELASALGWITFEEALPVVGLWLQPNAPRPLRRIGIAACAAHRRDPGVTLEYALLEDDPRLRARASRAVGELGRAQLAARLDAVLGAEDVTCRFWAAWSAALLGKAAAGPVLWTIADGGGPLAARACAMAMRLFEVREARARVEDLGAASAHARVGIAGAGALGDPASVPWLLDRMDDPATARLAGEAFTAITGIAITGGLAGKRPEGYEPGPSDDPADANVASDPDEALPWPALDALRALWKKREPAFTRGVRHVAGAPIARESLTRALREGGQRVRASAAIDLARLVPGKPLFEVRAPARRQRADL